MPLDLEAIARAHAHLDGDELLRPLLTGPLARRVALVSSFGTESTVLLHMAARIDRAVPVLFIDTGKLFWETRYYRSKLVDHLGLADVRILKPDTTALERHDPDGRLALRDPDLCCHIRKTLPLEKGLAGFAGWVSGRKRYHGGARAEIPVIEVADGRLKIDPLARWDRAMLEAYRTVNELPEHPLAQRGYLSVGCLPCTAPAGNAGDPRAGRWAGRDKTECGIHWTANGRPIRVTQREPMPASC